MSQKFKQLLNNLWIKMELIAPFKSHQNRVSKQKNYIFMEKTAAVLIVAQLNKVSSTKANNEVIPQKKLYGNKSCLDAIQIFGCTNYVHNKTYQTKIKSKAMVCKFVGYNKTSKIDRCFDPIKIKVILSQDIQFDKKNVWSNISSQIDKN
uniref:Retroviral polymerase SH3-like domain-containing protein n=1 Tax=Physcomitrium patens TaxID=3218 RepID=A0A2K1IJ27_PHYPA|nr:hypothetical protein PHYPA_027965 [Physcomitrium patens]